MNLEKSSLTQKSSVYFRQLTINYIPHPIQNQYIANVTEIFRNEEMNSLIWNQNFAPYETKEKTS